ncbi:JmjC domain-containing protein [Pseudacidovorax intermedius]|uniref:Cupin n=1 Tax=Pseudacidovorax intermedius TaxID=433924 RepID=A0A147GN45_9BURK|nr:cupin domain-containing protein [Pseudacidovorax intermedius]KTT14800.1 cupin [Pseudacidovorax intermedius]
MPLTQRLPLLGGLSAQSFMRRHWQKKPLLVRQALPMAQPPMARAHLFDLAGQEGVESRLVTHDARQGWRLRHGPFARRSLPPLGKREWTLLVQGMDLHDDAVHALLQPFRFLPEARLDDVMISYASDGGGVGPHFDSYDVFLLQVSGRRRWSWGRQKDLSLRPGLPLKVLEHFEPEDTQVLEPGDMLYLPPRYAHDGVAEGGDCMTCSIGLRAPAQTELAGDLLFRLADAVADDEVAGRRYADPGQPASENPAAIPEALQTFARDAVHKALAQPARIDCALGESLTEPKPNVWFEPGDWPAQAAEVQLDRRTRMLYDARHVFINGESLLAGGRDATLMRRLADQRKLGPRELARASEEALALLADWCEAGWLHAR